MLKPQDGENTRKSWSFCVLDLAKMCESILLWLNVHKPEQRCLLTRLKYVGFVWWVNPTSQTSCRAVLERNLQTDAIDFCIHLIFVVVVRSLSCVWFIATPWTIARQTPLSSTVSQGMGHCLPNSCPLCWWQYLTTLCSAVPFFYCLQYFPIHLIGLHYEIVATMRWILES